MTTQDGSATITHSQALEARARVNSARETINNMIAAKAFDASLLGAMQAIGNALHFIGTHSEYIEEEPERAELLYAIDPDLAARYVEHTHDLLTLLAMTTAFPDDLTDLAETTEDLLGRVVGLLEEIVAEETPMNSDLWNGADTQYLNAMTLRNSFNLWRRAIEASNRAETAADAAAESAGETAEHSLAQEFETLRNSEKSSADLFRVLTLLLFAGVLVFSGWVAFTHETEPDEVVWRKLALAVPALLFAAYLGREASQHRRTARWAGVLVAQLKSIRAYSIELPDEHRDELKSAFGRRVFLDSPDGDSQTSAESGQIDVPAIMREATNLARVSRGGP